MILEDRCSAEGVRDIGPRAILSETDPSDGTVTYTVQTGNDVLSDIRLCHILNQVVDAELQRFERAVLEEYESLKRQEEARKHCKKEMHMIAEILGDTAYAVLWSRIDDIDEAPSATSSPTATKTPVKLSRKIKKPVFKIGSRVEKPLCPLMSIKMDSRSVEAALLVAQEAKEREASKYTLSGSQL
ncbi:hypothetical protein E4T42_06708 [Aureobasidium subglaciale]|nr:hypothetical protein E4T42_06708 [Aureobasidium subglaciale]